MLPIYRLATTMVSVHGMIKKKIIPNLITNATTDVFANANGLAVPI